MAGANSNIQITDLDFNSIKDNLKTFLKSQDVLKDYNYEGSALSTLLDILAYNTQYNAYYLNMVANEMFLDSALQRNSVVSHAKILNYVPKSMVSPTYTANITVSGVTTTSLSLPQYLNFMSDSIDGVNYNFINTQGQTVAVTANTARFTGVELKQGFVNTISFTVDAAANPNYTFVIPDLNVDTTTLQVTVQESVSNSFSTVYSQATNYMTLNGASTVYFLQENMNGNYEISFGNDVLGKKLKNGNIVRLVYIITEGPASKGVSSFSLMDSIGGFSNTSVQMTSVISDGANRESIESIKYQAPKSYSAQGRAVTKEDYINAVQQNNMGFSFDAVNVWGGQENDPPVYGQVYICVKPSGAFTLTETQKLKLRNDVLRPISVMTVDPIIVDPDYTYLQLTATVYYDPKKTNSTPTQLQTVVRNAIQSYADRSLNTFNSIFTYSDFIAAVKNSDPSIISNDIVVNSQKKFFPKLSGPTTYNLFFNSPLQRGQFSSSITSSPAFSIRNPSNMSLTIDGIYIEEVPASSGGVESITVTNPGYSYQYVPTVTIAGDGQGATAVAVVNNNGTIREIKVTNKGSGYTNAIVKINALAGDTTGRNAQAVVLLEGRFGTLRSYYYNTDNAKTIINANVGTVDYNSGIVTLNSFSPLNVNNDLAQLTITAKPTTTIITSTFNRIITVDPFDPNAIIVNVIPKT